jgi:TRAP-type C4-dicarboxylate transport system substrate-binding protein
MNMKKAVQTVCLFVGVLTLAIFTAAIPDAAAVVKFGHVAPPFHGQSKGAEAFAAYVKDKTGGKIDIQTFPAGQLGGERSLAEQVQSGSLQIATVSTGVLTNFIPEAAVFDMPFIFPNRATAYAVLDDKELQDKFFSYFPAKGFIAVGWTENEIRDFSNSKKPIHTPEDLQGMKVRVMNAPVYIDTLRPMALHRWPFPFRKSTTPCRPALSTPRRTRSSPRC